MTPFPLALATQTLLAAAPATAGGATGLGLIHGLVGLAGVLIALGGVAIGLRRMSAADHRRLETVLVSELQAVKARLTDLERSRPRPAGTQRSAPPTRRTLSPTGRAMLAQTDVARLLEAKRDWLRDRVRAQHPAHAEEAEAAVLRVVEELPERFPECASTLQRAAHATGEEVATLLRLGGLDACEWLLPELGLTPTGASRDGAKTSEAVIRF